jgi:hypothetical protein
MDGGKTMNSQSPRREKLKDAAAQAAVEVITVRRWIEKGTSNAAVIPSQRCQIPLWQQVNDFCSNFGEPDSY